MLELHIFLRAWNYYNFLIVDLKLVLRVEKCQLLFLNDIPAFWAVLKANTNNLVSSIPRKKYEIVLQNFWTSYSNDIKICAIILSIN